MPTPAVKASTMTKTTENRGDLLRRAMAEVIAAGKEGRTGLEKISERLSGQEKSQHAKAMKRKK